MCNRLPLSERGNMNVKKSPNLKIRADQSSVGKHLIPRACILRSYFIRRWSPPRISVLSPGHWPHTEICISLAEVGFSHLSHATHSPQTKCVSGRAHCCCSMHGSSARSSCLHPLTACKIIQQTEAED